MLCKIPGKQYLGTGAFGKVYLAYLREDEQKFFAIKAIRKSMLIEHDIVEMTQLESHIMYTNTHANLIKMHYTFQNDYILYFVMDLIQGGELRELLDKQERFDESVVKLCCVDY